MRILLYRCDSTKIQYEWIEFDTKLKKFDAGNSATHMPIGNFDLKIEVKSMKELEKQLKYIQNSSLELGELPKVY